ncbi:uncharacterized protein KGF55_004427 [Candida pseudojiufengensis]|uniref:uncharacterized protein n=1 Tax=Candida pseudojiufengensis TaxID=497109 RepID=UPI002223F51D|nr:uncharacterized protein KGF55_004427 [Candida pseudojiufengensis]KAI5960857.1 hypothetical protein KGF55_004427 [Candida pseudojiufengensis]
MDDISSLEFGDNHYKPQKRILTFLFKNKIYPIPNDSERKLHPKKSSNLIFKIFFWWATPLMTIGYTRTLQPNDLWILTDDLKLEGNYEIFESYLDLEITRASLQHLEEKCASRNESLENSTISKEEDLKDFKLSAKSLALVLFLTLKREIIISVLMAVIAFTCWSVTPLVTKYLIRFVEEKTLGIVTKVGKGIGYSIGVVCLMFISNILFNHFLYIGSVMGAKVKAILTKAILDKSFKLNSESRHKYPQSKITSLITTDLSRIEIACLLQPLLLCLPVPIIIAIVILIVNIRVSAVIGVVIFIIFLGIISIGAKKLFEYRDIVSKITDKRVNLMKEILNNLKMIKYYSWEHPYHKNIMKVRGEEINMILKIQTLRNVIFSLAMTLTGICAMIAFIILYAIQGSTSSPATMFSSVTSFEILGMMVFFIPQVLSTTVDMINGFKRIGSLLSAPEEQKYEGYRTFDNNKDKDSIVLTNATFKWDEFSDNEEDEDDEESEKKKKEKEKEEAKNKRKWWKKSNKTKKDEQINEDIKLENLSNSDSDDKKDEDEDSSSNFIGFNDLNLQIKKGEFVVITGIIGSGKTSLLNAIAGFMTCESGTIDINGSLILCGAPWIQNNTIRENITFGSKFDQKFYDDVIYASALNVDIDNLEGGDYTEVGEKGITLSGGQKARINLARAIYANKEIILLDDVLSAVDARVGKHILNNCFLGLLKDKTRILATHQLSLIGQADRIIFLNGDGTINVGTMDELLKVNKEFNNLMKFSKFEAEEEKEEEELEEFDLGGIDEKTEIIPTLTKSHDSTQQLTKRRTRSETIISEEDEEYKDYNLNKDKSKGKLITEEERAINSIKWDIYSNYLKYGSGFLKPIGFSLVFVLLLSISTFLEIFANTWLSFWVGQKFPNRSNGFYIGLYVMFNLLWVIMLTYTYVFLVTGTTISSKNLNILAINRVLHAPMSFMDTTPMGRILNRFTKDTDALDNEITENMKMFFQSIAKMIGVFILLIIYLPWFACALPAIFILFFCIANFYQASNREVKRLEAILRSFVYNNVTEILSGMNTIKAFKEQNRFSILTNDLLNKANEATFVVNANQRWLGIQLDMLANCVILLVSLLCVNRVFAINAASVGLLMNYTLQVAGELNNLVRTFTQVENDMNSVERIIHYALKLDQEDGYNLKNDNNDDPNWPNDGSIEFVNANMKYRPGLPLVLKNLSVKIQPKERIGICGRTGAGKSSIMTALYRLSELDSGQILIDDVDIATLNLNDLRSHLSIIPQDPVLFNGTIRSNLDPFKQKDDEILWESLRRCGLLTNEEILKSKNISKDSEELPKFHLYQSVEDEGENFSLGERQLISFARALVRDSSILFMDEATSSINFSADALIQETIRTEFKDKTILTIAHRLHTIINYDKILVMDKGSLKEFDTPWNLFNQTGSVFREMCDKSNIVAEDFERR